MTSNNLGEVVYFCYTKAMITQHTPFITPYATADVGRYVHPSASKPLSLKNAAEIMENLGYNKNGYTTYRDERSEAMMYARSASADELVGQWARCALHACMDKNSFHHADIRTILNGFPIEKPMSQTHTKLKYLDHTVFEGSAWDLIVDMLLVPQKHDQTHRLSESVISWLTNNRNHGLIEKPGVSSQEKSKYLWECIVQRAAAFDNAFNPKMAFQQQNAEYAPDCAPYRTSLCDIMPHLFNSEEFVLQLVADPHFQNWIKHVAITTPKDVVKLLDAIIGAPLDVATKQQLGGHLTSLVGTEAVKSAINKLPRTKIVQGLWKSYFAVAQGCGVDMKQAIGRQINAFREAIPNNAHSTLTMDRYLPVFKQLEDFQYIVQNIPFVLWKKSNAPKTLPMDKAWAVLQKHDVVPPTLAWSEIQDELKGLESYTHEQQAQETLLALVQNHRLKQELLKTIESEAPQPTTRRRM